MYTNIKQIVIINGHPGSGKDTFVDIVSEYIPATSVHTSNPAKQALYKLGWDGEKSPEVRKVLSDLKQLSAELFDGSYEYIRQQLREIEILWATHGWVVFIHSREPEEIDRFKKEFNAITLLIDRKIDVPFTNEADSGVHNYNYDLVIDNNGDLSELREKAMEFVERARVAIEFVKDVRGYV